MFHRLSLWNCMISFFGLWRSTRVGRRSLQKIAYASNIIWCITPTKYHISCLSFLASRVDQNFLSYNFTQFHAYTKLYEISMINIFFIYKNYTISIFAKFLCRYHKKASHIISIYGNCTLSIFSKNKNLGFFITIRLFY